MCSGGRRTTSSAEPGPFWAGFEGQLCGPCSSVSLGPNPSRRHSWHSPMFVQYFCSSNFQECLASCTDVVACNIVEAQLLRQCLVNLATCLETMGQGPRPLSRLQRCTGRIGFGGFT